MVQRQSLWIDDSVQGVLIGRVVLYWILGILYVGLGSACFQYYAQPQWTFENHVHGLVGQFWPWLPSLILFLPLVIYDILRVSHQVSGPIHRLRGQLIKLAGSSECAPLNFRDDDYWQDLVKPVNDLQSEILALRMAVMQMAADNVARQSVGAAEPQERTEPALFSADVSQADRFLVGTGSSPSGARREREEMAQEEVSEELA